MDVHASSHAAPAATVRLNGSAPTTALRTRLVDALERNVFVVLVLAVGGLFRVTFLGLGIGSDTWYTLLGGRIVSRSWLPHADSLTVLSRGREWVDEQWLAHLLLYGLWTAGGWPLALLVLLATFLGAFAIAAATVRRLGVSARSTAAITFLALIVGVGESGYRAQTLALPLFAVVLFLLLDDERRPSARVYLTLPVLIVWANVHGSVVLGAFIVSLYGVTDATGTHRAGSRAAVRRSAGLIVLPPLCTLASPYALELPGYYVRLLHNPALSRFVTEWQPASIRNQPLFFALLIIGLLLVARSRRSTLFSTLTLVVTAIGGLLAVRSVVWFALAAAAILPSTLDAVWPQGDAPRRRRFNVSLAVTSTVALVVAAAAFASHGRSWFERTYPASAGDAVAAVAAGDPHLEVFANERYADWLLFEHPSLKGRVAYDARFELLTERQLTRIAEFRLEQGAAWLRAARGYRVLVLDPDADAGAVTLMREHGATQLYRDRNVVVLDRGRAADTSR